MRILIFFISFFPYLLFAQYESEKRDAVWLAGLSCNSETQICNNFIIDFSEENIETSSDNSSIGFAFTSAVISDKEGNLLYASNGCQIIDSHNEIIADSISYLNTDWVSWQSQCGSGGGGSTGYGTLNSAVFLPHANNQITLVHTGLGYFPDEGLKGEHLFITRLDSMGSVLQKNQLVTSMQADSFFTFDVGACRHGNGEDWWIIAATYGNHKFQKYLLTESDISGPYEQDIGTEVFSADGTGGATTFSRDGTKYASVGFYSQTKLYDFDRCTGELSNFQHLILEYEGDTLNPAGASFSPSGRFLYVNSGLRIFQYDLWSEDVGGSIALVAEVDGFLQDNGVTVPFGQQMLAADDRIYIAPSGGRVYAHVIASPDSLGLACDVQQHSIYSEFTTFGYGLPNTPNYRLGRAFGSPCDSLFTSVDEEILEEAELKVIPNPASNSFSFINIEVEISWCLSSISGQVVSFGKTSEEKTTVDISNLNAGLYFLSAENQTVKVVVQY